VNQAPEAVPPPHAVGDRDNGRCWCNSDLATARRAELQASVRSLVVVVAHVLIEDPLKMAGPPDQHPVQALLPDRPHPALGERIGVRRLHRCGDDLCTVGEANTSSKAQVNLLSRSRIRNRGVVVPSGRSIDSSRARWTTQGPFGWRVTPARRTCRVPSSMKNSTYSVVSRTVSTVKKSVATMPEACARRNARHVTDAVRGAGRSPLPRRTVRMVVADTQTRSFLSSPWMRRRPSEDSPGPAAGSAPPGARPAVDGRLVGRVGSTRG
jgi:hypothetical protein